MTTEQLKLAEAAVKLRAARIAYEATQCITNSDIQKSLFALYKDYIILGARLMQEELLNNQNHQENDTEKETH